ncbi:helix-turn-helix transcriptional regulator [Inquilinus limosus]|uniref:helix-turn-helix transcriptional regulator n=1 Tax=Inquilinus limosus TaxID=171674 RepID=UPI0009DBE120|nr:helix-turn-helix transcriptional regulator [Inquilinus limosus]
MINEALRLIRVFHDMKQSETAEKLGISKSYLSEIEKGHKIPTLELLSKYSSVFAIPASSIMFFSESMDKGCGFNQARNVVASKIIALMRFLEERSSHAHDDAT